MAHHSAPEGQVLMNKRQLLTDVSYVLINLKTNLDASYENESVYINNWYLLHETDHYSMLDRYQDRLHHIKKYGRHGQ